MGKRVSSLSREIERKVREDKKENLLEQFRENKEDPHKTYLESSQKQNGNFTPKFIQMRNKNGMLVPLKKEQKPKQIIWNSNMGRTIWRRGTIDKSTKVPLENNRRGRNRLQV